MKKIIDIHNHLNTLFSPFLFRSMIQKHHYRFEDYLREDARCLLSVAFYIPFFQSYQTLLDNMARFSQQVTKVKGVKIITSQKDLQDNFKLGLIFHIESARSLDQGDQQIPQLHQAGVRGIIPMHFIDNKLGNSCDDPLRRLGLRKRDQGLTKYGHHFIDICNKYQLWVDLTHTTSQTADDILNQAHQVMISHTGIQEIIPLKRNKSLKTLKKIKEKKGIIGIIPWQHLIGNKQTAFQEQIDFALKNGLEDSLAIGSDFGAPIKTHSTLKSSYDLAEQIQYEKKIQDKILWDNAYQFFYRSLS